MVRMIQELHDLSLGGTIPDPKEEERFEGVLDAITAVQIESLEGSQQSHASRLRTIFNQPNVVGIGISEKITQGRNTGKMSITFYVEKKLPQSELTGSKMIPPTVPASLAEGTELPTDVIELGKIRLQAGPFIQRTPIQPGNSIGHFQRNTGTLGAIVRRGKKRMLLSNSHVLALSGKAKKGDAILYPGRDDKGRQPKDVVARLDKYVTFAVGGEYVNELDCAVAQLETAKARPVNESLRGLAGPTGVGIPKRRMKVQIAGRTSGVSNPATIVDTHFRFEVTYPDLGASVGFKNQILCRPPYSKNGDSGALVIEQGSGRAVGLHFAGTPKGSVCCPIRKVLKKMNVTLELSGK